MNWEWFRVHWGEWKGELGPADGGTGVNWEHKPVGPAHSRHPRRGQTPKPTKFTPKTAQFTPNPPNSPHKHPAAPNPPASLMQRQPPHPSPHPKPPGFAPKSPRGGGGEGPRGGPGAAAAPQSPLIAPKTGGAAPPRPGRGRAGPRVWPGGAQGGAI